MAFDATVLPGHSLALLRRIFDDGVLGSSVYLGGGTALALQIGHRVSLDLDLFTVSPSETLSSDVRRAAGRLTGRVTLREAGQLDLVVQDTRVSVVAYPFALAHELVTEGSIRIASPPEIALMKAYALGRRITGRDYIDLYYLLRDRHVGLDEIRREGDRKFRLGDERVFSYMGFLRQLVDTTDVDDWSEALSLVRDTTLSRSTIDEFLVGLVQEVENGLE